MNSIHGVNFKDYACAIANLNEGMELTEVCKTLEIAERFWPKISEFWNNKMADLPMDDLAFYGTVFSNPKQGKFANVEMLTDELIKNPKTLELLEKIKIRIIKFTELEVEIFLNKNADLIFYVFAYDFNIDERKILLCFNTEEEFKKSLERYQKEYPEEYNTDEGIRSLKYSLGDMRYQEISSTMILTEEEITHLSEVLPEEDDELWDNFYDELYEIIYISLIDFTKTEVYKKIPKTNDFKYFAKEHNDSLKDAEKSLEEVRIANNL